MAFVERVVAEARVAPVVLAQLGKGLADQHPAVAEYMLTEVWDDGKARETATMLIFIEDGVWKGCLHDRANKRKLWRAGDCMHALFSAFEEALAEGTKDWRKDWFQGKSRR